MESFDERFDLIFPDKPIRVELINLAYKDFPGHLDHREVATVIGRAYGYMTGERLTNEEIKHKFQIIFLNLEGGKVAARLI